MESVDLSVKERRRNITYAKRGACAALKRRRKRSARQTLVVIEREDGAGSPRTVAGTGIPTTVHTDASAAWKVNETRI